MKRAWEWLIRHPWSAGALAVIGVFLVFAAVTWDSTEVPDGNRQYGVWGALAVFTAIAVVILAISIFSEWDNRRRYARGDRSVRIKELTDSLETGMKAANALKAEIEEGERVLQDIEQRMTHSKALEGLSQSARDAVVSLLRGELHRYGRRSVWRDVTIALFSAVAGLFLGRTLF